MGLAGGAISFQRFFVRGQLPGEVTEELVAALSERAFGKLPAQSDGSHMGWIGPAHLFETELLAERIAVGPYVHLQLRVDVDRIPPNVLKSYVRMEEETVLATTGREFLSRGERRQAKEAAQERAQQEAQAGAFRRMQSYPVVIDLAHGVVYLGNLATGVADRLMALFGDTFSATLDPASPEAVAARLMASENRARSIENLQPFHLVQPPMSFEGDANEFPGVDLGFLGKELLTWIWFQTSRESAPVTLRSGDDIALMIDQSVRLQCDYGITGSTTIAADGPTNLPETHAALTGGKQPTKLGLIIGSQLGEFRLTVDGPRLAVSGLVLPESDAELDARAQLEQRFELMTDAAALVDSLFELYLDARTSGEWPSTLAEMTAWVAGKKTQPKLHAASA